LFITAGILEAFVQSNINRQGNDLKYHIVFLTLT